MANNIKGITIAIGGDTKGLTDALKSVNNQSKKVQNELKEVERQLKLDPRNVELVRQKQELLTQAIQGTEEKLNVLRTAQAQVQQQFERGEISADQYRAFQRELIGTENEMQRLQSRLNSLGTDQDRLARTTRELGTFFDATGTDVEQFASTLGTRLTQAIRDGSATADQMERALRLMGRQALGAGADIDQMREALRNADNGANLDEIRRDLQRLGQAADEAQDDVNKLENALSTVSKSAKTGVKLGATAIAGVGIAAAGTAVGIGAFVESQKEMSSDLARLKTNAEAAGFSLESIEEGFKKVAAVSGEADSAVETMSNLMATDFSENQLAEALNYINGAAIKFSDTLKTEGIADGLQETFATGEAIGQFGELLERSGVDLDVFNKGLAQAAKSGTETDYVLQQLSQLGLASTYEAYLQNSSAIAEYNLAQVENQKKLAELSDVLRPLITSLIEMANVVIDVMLGNKDLAAGFNELANIAKDLGNKFLSAAKEALPKFVEGIKSALPQILDAGIQITTKIIEGIGNTVPALTGKGLDLIQKLASTLIDNLPKLLDAGVKMITSLISGISTNFPKLVETALNLVLKLASTIVTNLPKITDAGVKVLTSIIKGIANAIPQLFTYLSGTFIPGMVNIIKGADWIQIGKDVVNGLIQGIGSMAAAAIKSIKGVVNGIVNTARNILDINSPAAVFIDYTDRYNIGSLKKL